MEKLSNSDLQVLVDTLIDKLNKDNFKPNIIVAASESVDHLASKLSQYFSVGYTHIKGGHRANSNNILLQYAYSILRKIKKGFFRNIDSGDNHLLRISRKLVMEYLTSDPEWDLLELNENVGNNQVIVLKRNEKNTYNPS